MFLDLIYSKGVCSATVAACIQQLTELGHRPERPPILHRRKTLLMLRQRKRLRPDFAPAQEAPDIVPAQETPGISPSTQPPPQPQTSARTLRIRDIPLSVTEEEFRNYLKALLGYDDFVLSFVSGDHKITATVTLTSGEPAALSTCTPGNTIDLPYSRAEHGLFVDCDFHGMTPLYSAEEPTVE